MKEISCGESQNAFGCTVGDPQDNEAVFECLFVHLNPN